MKQQMKIFKFGGASVKDAAGVKNVLGVLNALQEDNLVVVISAMGKMTNAFEEIIDTYFGPDPEAESGFDAERAADLEQLILAAEKYHLNIVQDLGMNEDQGLLNLLTEIFDEMKRFLETNRSRDYDFVYDQVVSRGEMLSTRIVSGFLQDNGLDNSWLDVRDCIRTNSEFRRARVDWESTCKEINSRVSRSGITITQGFLGSDALGHTTTLGREGSDYTAGIFAYCLQADEVSIFKDVPGVLNADPREFKQTELLSHISYKEAIEMAFYGASVIHPKTLQPLQRKEIPLKVRSFQHPKGAGTTIKKGLAIEPEVACFIVKKKQILVSISDREFHFVMEEDISELFALMHEYRMKVNMIQNSAISFSVCIEDNFNNFDEFLNILQPKYKVLYNKNLTLYTVRHFSAEDLNRLEDGNKVLLKQMSRETAQMVLESKGKA